MHTRRARSRGGRRSRSRGSAAPSGRSLFDRGRRDRYSPRRAASTTRAGAVRRVPDRCRGAVQRRPSQPCPACAHHPGPRRAARVVGRRRWARPSRPGRGRRRFDIHARTRRGGWRFVRHRVQLGGGHPGAGPPTGHMTDVSVRVLVADDHPVVRDGLRALLLADPATELVGEAGDGDAAIALALRLRPDVVVMDLQLPGTDGIQATQALTEAVPGVAVLVLTMRADGDALFAALRAGASGYLLKGAAGQDVL